MSYSKEVNQTARSKGAVGRQPVAFKYLRSQVTDVNTCILDFGSGPEAKQTQQLRSEGFYNAGAWDIGDNFNPKVHRLSALTESYDVVVASNVLNVQPSMDYLHWVLATVGSVTDPEGMLIANYPRSPRKMALLDGDALHTTLMQYFADVSRPKNYGRMLYVCKKPFTT